MLEEPAEIQTTKPSSLKSYNSMDDSDSVSIPPPAERYFVIFGIKLRKASELEPVEIAFLVFANISLIMAVAMAAYRVDTSSHDTLDFIFAVLLIVNLLFVLYYIFHGVFMERPYEILVSLFTVLIVMIYCIVDFASSPSYKRTDLKKVRLAVICLLGPVDIGLGIAVAIKFFEGPGNLMCRLVGYNVGLQKICKKYFIFTAFLGFDFQIVIILLVLILFDEPAKLSNAEKLIIGIGVPLSAVAVVIGRIGTRLENKIMSFVFLSFCVAEPAYIVYLFDRFGMRLEQVKKNGLENRKILYSSVIAAGALGLLVRLILVILAVVVIWNFGKGLKAKLYPGDPGQNPDDVYQRHDDEAPQ